MTLTVNDLEHGALLALVGLAVAVMQHDRANVDEFAKILSQPGMDSVCQALVERLGATEEDAA